MSEENLVEARIRYEKKRVQKHVSFNRETESELLAFANSVDFSGWVKSIIRETLAENNRPSEK